MRLSALSDRLAVVERELEQPATARDGQRLAELAREHARLAPTVQSIAQYEKLESALADAHAMLSSEDRELVKLAQDEIDRIEAEKDRLERQLLTALIPSDPDEGRNLFLEIRAGTGGEEAALFASDLLRMYLRYSEKHRWSSEVIALREAEMGGIKEAVLKICGSDAYQRLRYESGTHRVQRVPKTESQGRIHTSTCTVAILPEATNIDEVNINSADLRIDTYRASGAGGQHVNRTDSAVRITHIPSGLVVECQNERSQHQNKARALSILTAKLLAAERAEKAAERSEQRRMQVGNAERSEKIRTYNFPQSRITDHRIGLSLYQLESVLSGDLDLVVDPLIENEHEKAIAELALD